MKLKPKPSFFAKIRNMLRAKPSIGTQLNGRVRKECERCLKDVMLEISKEGEILNMRFVGMVYTCKECLDILDLWDEGERVWVRKNR